MAVQQAKADGSEGMVGMNERKKAMQESLVQADSGASQTCLRSPEQGCTSKEYDDALKYATNLCVLLAEKHFDANPSWRPLPDLYGVISQIDNMTSALVRDNSAARAKLNAQWADEITHLRSVNDDLVAALEAFVSAETFDALNAAESQARAAILKARGEA